MNIISELNNFYNSVYIYRLSIGLIFTFATALILLHLQIKKRLDTELEEKSTFLLNLISIIEGVAILNVIDKNNSQFSDIIFILLKYIIFVIIIEIVRLVEFINSKKTVYIDEENGKYRYNLNNINVKFVEDDRYMIKDIKNFLYHCKDEEAECKLISKEYIKYRKCNEVKFKIVSKVRYSFLK